jgi:hypothetical protein
MSPSFRILIYSDRIEKTEVSVTSCRDHAAGRRRRRRQMQRSAGEVGAGDVGELAANPRQGLGLALARVGLNPIGAAQVERNLAARYEMFKIVLDVGLADPGDRVLAARERLLKLLEQIGHALLIRPLNTNAIVYWMSSEDWIGRDSDAPDPVSLDGMPVVNLMVSTPA